MRRLAVLDPLMIKITNFKTLNLPKTTSVQNHPTNASLGARTVTISDTMYIGTVNTNTIQIVIDF